MRKSALLGPLNYKIVFSCFLLFGVRRKVYRCLVISKGLVGDILIVCWLKNGLVMFLSIWRLWKYLQVF